jgi:uncharacterized membrane protein YidH (DUF202 family)
VTPDPDHAPGGGPAGPAEEMEDLDPGAARARTELAWRRTAIAYAALGAALLRASPPSGGLVLAASAMIWGTGRLARAPRRAGGGRRLEANELRLLLITVAVTAVSLGALALVVLATSALPFR